MTDSALLPLVLAGHFIGDWIVQTDWQAANKTHSWAAMAAHMLSYHACLAVLLLYAGIPGLAAGVILVGSVVTHSFIDRRWPVKALLRATGSGAFAETMWGVLAADQALHLSILCVLVAAVTR